MGCEDCKAQNRFTYETAMALAERTIKRLWIVVIILIILFVGTNAMWIAYESQFEVVETTETEVEATQFGFSTNIVNTGDMTYGAEGQGKDNNH